MGNRHFLDIYHPMLTGHLWAINYVSNYFGITFAIGHYRKYNMTVLPPKRVWIQNLIQTYSIGPIHIRGGKNLIKYIPRNHLWDIIWHKTVFTITEFPGHFPRFNWGLSYSSLVFTGKLTWIYNFLDVFYARENLRVLEVKAYQYNRGSLELYEKCWLAQESSLRSNSNLYV